MRTPEDQALRAVCVQLARKGVEFVNAHSLGAVSRSVEVDELLAVAEWIYSGDRVSVEVDEPEAGQGQFTATLSEEDIERWTKAWLAGTAKDYADDTTRLNEGD